jgi:DNA-binding LacI/PurR family transcriptional regulator
LTNNQIRVNLSFNKPAMARQYSDLTVTKQGMFLMPVRRAATLKDVAQEAGVSKVAVSVVLNGSRSNVGVSAATRQRILDSAERLHYRPNPIARSLRLRSTNVIGLYSGSQYAPARGGAFLSQIVAGLQDGCDAHSRDLLVHGAFRGQSVDDIYQELASGKIDGLVLHAPGNDALVNLLSDASLPCVVIASPVESLPSVVVDDAAGMRLVAEHLCQRGHRRVAFRQSFLRHTSSLRRASAFCESATTLGMRVQLISPGKDENELSPEESALLAGPRDERPTAIVCWNDTSAYGLMACCAERGMEIPNDLALTGFNGFTLPGIPRWRLTTVRAPWRAVAKTALELLVAHIRGDQIPRETTLPVTLEIGDTT